ncbi:MAG: hypothetical protein WCT40_03055 [Candidatus Magasanikbacteria bacterium]
MPKMIAIDIALFPPGDITSICIKVNNRAIKNGHQGVLLNRVDNFPHISLFMGAVKYSDLGLIDRDLQLIMGQFNPIVGVVSRLYSKAKDSAGIPMYYFDIKNTKQLQHLHELIVKKIRKYVCGPATQSMFYKNKNEKISRGWKFVSNYLKNSSFIKFNPHITLRTDHAKFRGKLPIKFNARRIAICHLGDHCTCRKILWEGKLK